MKCNWYKCEKEAVEGRNFCGNKCTSKFCMDRRRREIKFLAIEYKGGACLRCGYNKCRRALEFHHRDKSAKSFSISSNTKVAAWSKIKKELDKCDLLCSNCHREVENEEIFGKLDWFGTQEYQDWAKAKLDSSIKKTCKCGKVIERKASKCMVCNRKVERPDSKTLEKLLWTKPTTKIAKDYGVSDKAIEKWVKSYGLSKPSRGYWAKNKIV